MEYSNILFIVSLCAINPQPSNDRSDVKINVIPYSKCKLLQQYIQTETSGWKEPK